MFIGVRCSNYSLSDVVEFLEQYYSNKNWFHLESCNQYEGVFCRSPKKFMNLGGINVNNIFFVFGYNYIKIKMYKTLFIDCNLYRCPFMDSDETPSSKENLTRMFNEQHGNEE